MHKLEVKPGQPWIESAGITKFAGTGFPKMCVIRMEIPHLPSLIENDRTGAIEHLLNSPQDFLLGLEGWRCIMTEQRGESLLATLERKF